MTGHQGWVMVTWNNLGHQSQNASSIFYSKVACTVQASAVLGIFRSVMKLILLVLVPDLCGSSRTYYILVARWVPMSFLPHPAQKKSVLKNLSFSIKLFSSIASLGILIIKLRGLQNLLAFLQPLAKTSLWNHSWHKQVGTDGAWCGQKFLKSCMPPALLVV